MPSLDFKKMIGNCPVEREWFFMEDYEKTNFAWFHYEYACGLFDYIKRSRSNVLRRWKSERSELQIAEFCAYFAKRMQHCMYEVFEGRSTVVECKSDYVRDYCHRNTKRENTELAISAQKAMLKHMDSCFVCPRQCTDNPGVYCELFDRVE
jgi:hypothetical protein